MLCLPVYATLGRKGRGGLHTKSGICSGWFSICPEGKKSCQEPDVRSPRSALTLIGFVELILPFCFKVAVFSFAFGFFLCACARLCECVCIYVYVCSRMYVSACL